MTYHPLAQDSGSDDSQRREEAQRVIDILLPYIGEMTRKEATFVEQMDEGGPVSVKQLFYLRDLKEKYAE